MKVLLVVTKGKSQGMEIPVKGSNFLIGRGQECQLRPNSKEVSKEHCVIQCEGETLTVRDLASTNGTFLNDNRIEGKVVVKDGDLLSVGPLEFTVKLVAEKPVVKAPDDANIFDAVEAGDPDGPSSSFSGVMSNFLMEDDGVDEDVSHCQTTVTNLRVSQGTNDIDTVPEEKSGAKPSLAEPAAPAKPAKPPAASTGDTHDAADRLLKQMLIRKRK